MLNLPLINKTLDYIRANPDEHDQSEWAKTTDCGTTMCFAGTAVFLSGGMFVWNDSQQAAGVHTGSLPEEARGETDVTDIEEAALVLLGMDSRQGSRLFYGCVNLRDLEETVEDLVREESETAIEAETFA